MEKPPADCRGSPETHRGPIPQHKHSFKEVSHVLHEIQTNTPGQRDGWNNKQPARQHSHSKGWEGEGHREGSELCPGCRAQLQHCHLVPAPEQSGEPSQHCQFAMKIGISVLPHEHWGEIHGAQSSGHSWMCPIPSLTEPWAREQQTWHAKGTGIPQNKPIKKGTDTQRGSGRSWPAIPSRLWVLLLPFPALCLGLERWMTGTAQFSC